MYQKNIYTPIFTHNIRSWLLLCTPVVVKILKYAQMATLQLSVISRITACKEYLFTYVIQETIRSCTTPKENLVKLLQIRQLSAVRSTDWVVDTKLMLYFQILSLRVISSFPMTRWNSKICAILASSYFPRLAIKTSTFYRHAQKYQKKNLLL